MEFSIFLGVFLGFVAWIIVLIMMGGIYTARGPIAPDVRQKAVGS
jgi:hypothetical protein